MSPIFLWFAESLWSYKFKRSKRKDQEIPRKIWNAITPEYLGKLCKLLLWWMAAVIQSKDANIKYSWVCNRFSVHFYINKWSNVTGGNLFISKIVRNLYISAPEHCSKMRIAPLDRARKTIFSIVFLTSWCIITYVYHNASKNVDISNIKKLAVWSSL